MGKKPKDYNQQMIEEIWTGTIFSCRLVTCNAGLRLRMMSKIIQGDGQKWLEWLAITRNWSNGWTWLEIAGMTGNGFKWLEMVGNGLK